MTRYRHPANPERAAAEAERRRSSIAQPHQDRRTRRARTRSDARAQAVKDFA